MTSADYWKLVILGGGAFTLCLLIALWPIVKKRALTVWCWLRAAVLIVKFYPNRFRAKKEQDHE